MMTWCFTSLSTLFKSYRDDRRVIMKGPVQSNAIQSWAEFCHQGDSNPRLSNSKLGVFLCEQKWTEVHIQLNFNGSNIFKSLEICSRNGKFEPLTVNHRANLRGKWGQFREAFSNFYKIMVCWAYSLESLQWGNCFLELSDDFFFEVIQKQVWISHGNESWVLKSLKFYYIQSTLVISTSFISNNHLSRSENLVPVLARKSNNR